MCPPSRLLTAAARSRLTWLPTPTPRRLDRFSVSPMTSALNAPSGSTSTTVRQTPFTAIESPCPASAVTTGPRMTRRAESPRSSLPTTSPSSSTIPVNIDARLTRQTLLAEESCLRVPKVQFRSHVSTSTGSTLDASTSPHPLRCTHADAPVGHLRRPFCRHLPFRGVLLEVAGLDQGTPGRRHPAEGVQRDHQI